MRPLRLPILLAFTVAAAPAAAGVQQVADPAFHVAVAQPAFTERPLRVLFDEAHHNFHSLQGRYRPFAALLEADGCRLTPGTQPFTRSLLAACDLLVIVNAAGDDLVAGTEASVARAAFTPAEIEAVHVWVEAGGRLFLIAGHTPFGEAAACLAQRFGVDMGRGFTLDSTLALAGQQSPFVMDFTRAGGRLGEHPIMAGRSAAEEITRLIAFTGQSLRGPRDATPLLLLSPAALDLPPSAQAAGDDLEAMHRLALPAAGRAVGVALVAGQGRVVVIGEPGMLTAEIVTEPDREPQRIGMNVAGTDNVQFVLNIVHWLAGLLPADAEPAGAVDAVGLADRSRPEAAPPSAANPAATGTLPDFSGTWRLAAQETEAWRGQGSIGNHEEPVRIEQTATQLSFAVQSADPTGRFHYDLIPKAGTGGPKQDAEQWSSATWDGQKLVTRGHRLFNTPKGPKAYDFEEERRLLPGGERMQVKTRIEMWPSDLVRSTEYERVH